MSSILIWLFVVIVLVGIVSSIIKIKEEFRSRGGGKKKEKGKKLFKKTANNIKTGNVMLAPAIINTVRKNKKHNNKGNNILKLKENNVVVPNDASIEFGAGVSGKEVNAGKIRYGGWDGGALNIVGAGGNGQFRNVRLWDKLQVGPLEIQEDGCIGYGPGKKFTFCFQPDGNIVQYKDKKPIWATGTP